MNFLVFGAVLSFVGVCLGLLLLTFNRWPPSSALGCVFSVLVDLCFFITVVAGVVIVFWDIFRN